MHNFYEMDDYNTVFFNKITKVISSKAFSHKNKFQRPMVTASVVFQQIL